MRPFYFVVILLLFAIPSPAQDGRILEKSPFVLPDSIKRMVSRIAPPLAPRLDSVSFFRITYLSDGLKVKGIVAEPKAQGKFPCIISNRGGNRDFGKWDDLTAALILGNYASWGYVVVASQYRGVDGGEGKEQFGGKDVNDVTNLFPLLSQLPKADTARIGMEGGSRGGMMTYMVMRKTCRLKAAVIISGSSDLLSTIHFRPEMEKHVYSELIPDYAATRESALKERSAVYWPDELCKKTPLLILHGSADWRISPKEAFAMVEKLYDAKHPLRFILYEGADHGLTEVMPEAMEEIRKHFQKYLKEGRTPPNLEPHGR